MVSKKTYLIFCLLIFKGLILFSQVDLKKIDNKAYEALENHSALTEKYANDLISLAEIKKSSSHLINGYTILGILNKDKGYYISSLNYYLKALNIAEKSNDLGRVSAIMNNIGVIYQLQLNFVSAIDYFNKSLKIEENFKKPLQKSIRYYNIGDCFKEIDSFDLALSYFNNSLLIEERAKNNEGVVYAYLGISEVYLKINQFVDAKRILDKIEKKLNPKLIECSIIYYKLLGKYHFLLGENKEALKFYSIANEISIKVNYPNHLLEIYKGEISVYEKESNWELASRKYKEYTLLSNKLSAIDIKNKIHDLTYSHELQKKEIQISRIQGERDYANKLNIFNTKITWFLILMLISFVAFVFYAVNKRRKIN